MDASADDFVHGLEQRAQQCVQMRTASLTALEVPIEEKHGVVRRLTSLLQIPHSGGLLLLEIQGSFETPEPRAAKRTRQDDGEGARALHEFGDVSIDETTNVCWLRVGYHRMEGRIVTLPKPVAIVRRRGGTAAAGGGEESPVRARAKQPDAVEVVAIVRKKVLFNIRPEPIVTDTALAASR